MDLTVFFEKMVRNFSRYNKYILGSELREKSRQIVELIIKANSIKKSCHEFYPTFARFSEKINYT